MKNNKTKKFKTSNSHKSKEIEQERMLVSELEGFLTIREEDIDKLFSKLSHEFRTPLVPILAYSQMLLEGHFGDLTSSQKKRVSIIKSSADELLQLLSNKKLS